MTPLRQQVLILCATVVVCAVSVGLNVVALRTVSWRRQASPELRPCTPGLPLEPGASCGLVIVIPPPGRLL